MAQQSSERGLWFDAEKRAAKPYDKELIPRRLVYAMFGVAAASLAITAFAVLTDRPPTGAPIYEDALRSHTITLSGEGNHALIVADSGEVLLDGPGGFITVVRDGMSRARLKAGVEGNPAVTITQYGNGRMALHDPASGWQVELTSFGQANATTFLNVLNGS